MDQNTMDDLVAAIRRAMIHVLICDRQGRESEYAALNNVFMELTGQSFAAHAVKNEIALAQKYPQELEEMLKSLRWRLEATNKAVIIRACVAIAFADCSFHGEEMKLVVWIGEMLGLDQSEVMMAICTPDC